MAENKIAIYITSILSVFSLLLALRFYCLSCEFIYNLFLGVFASGLVALLISITNYLIARKRTLEKFAVYMLKAAKNYNLFNKDGDIDEAINSVIEISKFDYTELDNAFANISLFFRNRKNQKYIYESIYSITVKERELIHRNSQEIIKIIKKKDYNIDIVLNYIAEIDKSLIVREHYEGEFNGKKLSTHKIENKVYLSICNQISGKYYKIMYPKFLYFYIDKENEDSKKMIKDYLYEISTSELSDIKKYYLKEENDNNNET